MLNHTIQTHALSSQEPYKEMQEASCTEIQQTV